MVIKVNKKLFRRLLLVFSVGISFGMLSLQTLADNSDGSINGTVVDGSKSAVADSKIVILNKANGYTRTISSNADGSFRFSRLPIGRYTITVTNPGFETRQVEDVQVIIGGSTELSVVLTEGRMEEVIVTAASRQEGVNVGSSGLAMNLDWSTIERLPISRDIRAVALLAPGVNAGPAFNGISFGGSSVGENSVFVNGLNVSDVETGVGYSTVPFSMFEQFQVKTGGYSVEYGRTTGGVVNTVLKSGGNEWEFGGEIRWTPDALRASGKDFYNRANRRIINNSDNKDDDFEGTLYASGPIIKDKLFFYATYEPHNYKSDFGDASGSSMTETKNDNAFWGVNIDWLISENHSINGFVFSDKGDEVGRRYIVVDGSLEEIATTDNGGTNWAATYTGYLTDKFMVKVLYGQNERTLTATTSNLDDCNRVYDNRDGVDDHISCTTARRGDHRENSRDALRIDMEYDLGDHLLRFGYDHEKRTTLLERASVGPMRANVQIYDTFAGDIINSATVPDGVTAYYEARREIRGGTFDADTSAAYIEDIWAINDTLTATIGLRWDSFDSKDAEGDSFIKVDNMFSPRFAIVWDVKGNGESKLYANAGRYYFPIANGLAAREGGGTIDTRNFYVLDGVVYNETTTGLTNATPVQGVQLGDTVEFGSGAGLGDSHPFKVDQDLDASKQDEFILGYEGTINEDWSYGVRGIYRKFKTAIEDLKVVGNIPGCGSISKWVFGNLGEPLTIDHLCDDDMVRTVTIDLNEAQQLGYNDTIIGGDKPVRKYYALQLVVDRHWDGKWMAYFSYSLSKSKGNYEGGVNSDTGNDIPGWTEAGDDVMFVNSNYGRLPNDHRHNFKFYAAYSLIENLRLGANFSLLSGAPINARGHGNPFNSQTRKAMNYLCVANCVDPGDGVWTSQDREFDYLKKGIYGDTPWLVGLDLNLTYFGEVKGHNWRVALDVFNVLNSQQAIRVHEDVTGGSIEGVDDDFLAVRTAQDPRSMRLTASFDF